MCLSLSDSDTCLSRRLSHMRLPFSRRLPHLSFRKPRWQSDDLRSLPATRRRIHKAEVAELGLTRGPGKLVSLVEAWVRIPTSANFYFIQHRSASGGEECGVAARQLLYNSTAHVTYHDYTVVSFPLKGF